MYIAPIIARQVARIPDVTMIREARAFLAGLVDLIHIVEMSNHDRPHEMEDCAEVAFAWPEESTRTGRMFSPIFDYLQY